MFARDQWHCRICGDRFLYSEMVRKHIANEHHETMPPSMYEYFHGAVWQRKKLPCSWPSTPPGPLKGQHQGQHRGVQRRWPTVVTTFSVCQGRKIQQARRLPPPMTRVVSLTGQHGFRTETSLCPAPPFPEEANSSR